MNAMKRALIAMFLAAAMMLAACGGGQSVQPTTAPAQPTTAPAQPTTAPAQQVTIRIWHQWDGAYLTAIEQAFRDYEASHPNVKIDLSKPEDVSNALNVAIPAGEGPDIIGWANDQIGQQALVGNIVALNDYSITEDFLRSTYEPAAVKGVIWQDKIWALPETQEGIALIYNKKVIGDMKLPATLDELLQMAKDFRAANPDKTLVCNQGFGGSDAYHVAPIYFGYGVPSYVDDEGKVYVNSPEMIKGGEWLAEMSKVSFSEQSYDICKAALAEGKAAMWWTGPWAIAGIEQDGVDYGILPLGKPFVGIKTLMLTRNAVERGNAEVALDIMKYFTSAEVQAKLALANKTVPAATTALKNPEVAALPTLAGFGASLNAGVPMANTPFAAAQWGPVGDASVAIWTGTQSPADALAAAAQAIEAAIMQMK